MSRIMKKNPVMRRCCIGGGRIDRNNHDRVIRIWGDSGDFGEEPDRSLTVKMLQKAFLDFQIIF